jgi:hypothetical protein
LQHEDRTILSEEVGSVDRSTLGRLAEELGEQHGLLALRAAATEAELAAESVAVRAASLGDEALATVGTLVDGVGDQFTQALELGRQPGSVRRGQVDPFASLRAGSGGDGRRAACRRRSSSGRGGTAGWSCR